ncbi:hypothetical protein I33_3691 [Bacillus subtilis subsp. subtilis str. RO-NN-1]|nr:hypothetical protein I33_3691 [Bacillus subtilis subsp. subtilis str. RO-NN-1]
MLRSVNYVFFLINVVNTLLLFYIQVLFVLIISYEKETNL